MGPCNSAPKNSRICHGSASDNHATCRPGRRPSRRCPSPNQPRRRQATLASAADPAGAGGGPGSCAATGETTATRGWRWAGWSRPRAGAGPARRAAGLRPAALRWLFFYRHLNTICVRKSDGLAAAVSGPSRPPPDPPARTRMAYHTESDCVRTDSDGTDLDGILAGERSGLCRVRAVRHGPPGAWLSD